MSEQTSVDHEKVMQLFGSVVNDVAGSVAIMMSYFTFVSMVYCH